MVFIFILICIVFVGLGLPDGVIGAVWPPIYTDLKLNIAIGSLMTVIAGGCTIISSINCGRLVKKFGTGRLTAGSILLTAIGIFILASANNIFGLILCAIPFGLGAGAVDSALNNFVSQKYKSSHMNWLHCFWGVGAMTSPYLVGIFLDNGLSWRAPIVLVACIITFISLIMFLSLPKWKKLEAREYEYEKNNIDEDNDDEGSSENLRIAEVIKIPQAKFVFLAFFSYISLELLSGAWGSTYLVEVKGLSHATAAKWIAMFFLGITLARFISGFIAIKLSNLALIRGGEALCLTGLLLMLLPLPSYILPVSFALLGAGCAPIFPSMLQETPTRFGKKKSATIMGLQMAIAYLGAIVSPIFGFVATNTSFAIMPYIMLFFALVLIGSNIKVNRICNKKNQ